MATSTLRAAIVVALVIGGILVINRAFPEASTGTIPDGGGGITQSPTAPPTGPTGGSGPTGGTGGDQQQEPEIVGMNVAVRNGTSVSGLAGDTAASLEERYGVNAIQIDDAPSTVSVTTIYHRGPSTQDEAELLAQEFFKKIEPAIDRLRAGSGVDPDVQIAIYLGTDYATAKA